MPISAQEILDDPFLSNLVRDLHDAGFIKWSDDPFKLKSGIFSHVYVYGREDLTDRPDLLFRFGQAIAMHLIRSINPGSARKQLCLIGIPTAGTPFAAATSLASHGVIGFRVMREAPKEHGAHAKTLVNDRPSSDQIYATIDNVITDGASKTEAATALNGDGYDDLVHIIVVDRGNGGVQKIEAAGLKTLVVFTLDALTEVFVRLGLWTQERRITVLDEIQAHQFV